MIYIDSDGVLSDFDQWLIDVNCANHNNSNEVFKSIIEHQDRVFLESKQIRANNWIRRKMKRSDFRVLTALPDKDAFRKFFNSDEEFNSCYNKLKENKYIWFEKIGIPRDKVIVTSTREEKFKYCTSYEDILYDDYPDTIKKWRSLGGTGVLVRNPKCKAQRERHYKYAINNFDNVIDRVKLGIYRQIAKRNFKYLGDIIDYDTCIKISKKEAERVAEESILPFIMYNPYLGKIFFTTSEVAAKKIMTSNNKEEPLEEYLYNCFPLIVRKPNNKKMGYSSFTRDVSCLINALIPISEKKCGVELIPIFQKK